MDIPEFTLGLILDKKNENILLGAKKKTNSGFTVSLGKRNGPGGKLEIGETVEEGIIREIYEESKIQIAKNSLLKKGRIEFIFEDKEVRNRNCTIFLISGYNGGFEETEEMKRQRRPINDLPWENMWEGDKQRLEKILSGNEINAKVVYDKTGKMISIDFI